MRKPAIWAILAFWTIIAGCGAEFRYYNTVARVQKPGKTYHQGWTNRFLKNNYYFPVRDAFDPNVLVSLLDPNAPAAWNIDRAGNVPDGSFYTNRHIEQLTAQQAAVGPAGAAPQGPWKIIKTRQDTIRPSFIGQDATGRRFYVKLDDPDFPQAASAAAIISTRILYLLGYHVPANYIVTITGTGDSQFDDRRAEASEFVPGEVLGQFKFDWLRYRREIRALRLASAWLDDLDRSDNNDLLVYRDGRSYYYLLDFDSTLGLWHGRPKQPWQAHRHLWDPPQVLYDIVTLTICKKPHNQPVSSAVGVFYADDFEPLQWKAHHPNSAFRFMSYADAAWIAKKIASITPQHLEAIVAAGKYSNPKDADHVLQILLQRQKKIIELATPQ